LTPSGGKRSTASYIPFIAGTRICPGVKFTILVGPLIVALLVLDYKFIAEVFVAEKDFYMPMTMPVKPMKLKVEKRIY